MPFHEQELAFSDQVGRHFARQYGMPPMVGRVAGWLLICDPPEQTAAQIAAALSVSRSAVGSALDALESFAFIRRTRTPGERADRVMLNPEAGAQGLDSRAEFGAMATLARHGLEVLADAPLARRGRLLELASFYDWLLERMPLLAREWSAHREQLRAAGTLPDPRSTT